METLWINLLRDKRKIGRVKIPSTVGDKKDGMEPGKTIGYEIINSAHLDLVPGVFLDLPIKIKVHADRRGLRSKHQFLWAEIQAEKQSKKKKPTRSTGSRSKKK